MKQLRLVCTVLALVAAGTWVTAHACEEHAKSAKATAKLKAKNAAAAADCCAHGAKGAAVTAEAADACQTKKAKSAVYLSAGAGAECGAHGAKGAKFTTAGAGACAHDAAAMASMGCTGHGAAAAAHRYAECEGCESCADMANCEKQLESVGAVTQIVPLKNGVMYVYTADNPNRIRTVQAALARRSDRMVRLASAGERTQLCPPCKELRGASASGKLYRETVNIEGGCLTLMTSSDPTVVKKIFAMAGLSNGARAKS